MRRREFITLPAGAFLKSAGTTFGTACSFLMLSRAQWYREQAALAIVDADRARTAAHIIFAAGKSPMFSRVAQALTPVRRWSARRAAATAWACKRHRVGPYMSHSLPGNSILSPSG